jgi:predicted dehydrogenase
VIDVTIIGSGTNAAACAGALSSAGFRLHHTLEVDSSDRSPIILGEAPSAFALARQAVEMGRHVLIASPSSLSPERLSLLLDNRKRAQALFVWSERRYHPAYRFIGALVEADTIWQPRFLRLETLTVEPPASAQSRWLTLESLTLAISLAGCPAESIRSHAITNPTRHAPDLLSLLVSFPDIEASIHIGLGEPVERRETLLATADRKAYIDELNQSTPIRVIEDERGIARGSGARWLSCQAPTSDELARQQCLAFLDATLKSQLARDEAELWLRSLAALDASERSLAQGTAASVEESSPDPVFRLISGTAAQSA